MKYLTVIRHAKSKNPDTSRPDLDRELKDRGRVDAAAAGRLLLERNAVPDVIVASSAIRVRQTVAALNEALEIAKENILYDDSLYMALHEEMAAVVKGTRPEVSHLAVVGHNPCVTNYVNTLCAENIESMTTSGMAHIKLDIESWDKADFGSGNLVWVETR